MSRAVFQTDSEVSAFRNLISNSRDAGACYLAIGRVETLPNEQLDSRLVADTLAAQIGLTPLQAAWIEVSPETARLILTSVLTKDLAYGQALMPAEAAANLIDEFLRLSGCKGATVTFLTNGNVSGFKGIKQVGGAPVLGYTPITDATFDTGIIAVCGDRGGLMWFADED